MSRNEILSTQSRLLCMLLLLCSCYAAAQVPSQLNTGYPENGIFHGSDIDNVQINNGGLHIGIPIYSAKGRGLDVGAKVVYNSKSWTFHTRCFTSGGGFCEDDVQGDPLGYPTLAFFGAFDYTFATSSSTCTTGGGTGLPDISYTTIGGYAVREPDGTKHHFVPDPLIGLSGCVPPKYAATLYADDGSGWTMHLNTSDGTIIEAISKNGTRIQPPGGINSLGTRVPAALIVDANGNQMSSSNTCCSANGWGGTDTLGRSILANGAYYDSSGAPRSPSFSGSVSVAIDTTPLCLFSNADTCVPDKTTWALPTQLNLPNGDVYSFTYAQNAAGELTSMTLPTGGNISWSWGDWNTGGRNVATRTVSANGVAGTWTYDYTQSPSVATVTDPANKGTRYTCTVTNPNPHPSCDAVNKVEYFDGPVGSSSLIKTVSTDYSPCAISNSAPATPCYLPIRETTTWNQKNLVMKTETDWDSMAVSGFGTINWRNPIEKRVFDWGSGAAGALLQRVHSSYRHLETDGGSYLSFNLADLPTLVQTYDGAGSLVAQTQNSYDGGGVASTGTCTAPGVPNHDYCNFGQSYMVRGNLTQASRWINTSNTWVNTTNAYDDLGNLRTSTDPGNHQTTFDYTDSWGGSGCVTASSTLAFPTTVTNALGQRTKTSYFPCTSLVQSKRDENDIAAGRPGTTFTYDLMNRLLVSQTLDSGGQILAKTAFTYNDLSLPLSITKTVTAAPSPDVVSTVYMDGLGRTSQTLLNDPEGNVTTEITYDSLGRKHTETNPHRSVAAVTDGTTQFVYDALGRTTDVIKQDGNTTHTDYAASATTVTDETGRQRKTKVDGLGRLVEVDEPGDPSLVQNDYATMQTDGNFVLYTPSGTALWATGTAGSGGSSIEIQDDGNFVLYIEKWQAGTYATPSAGPFPAQTCSIGSALNAPQTLASGQCIVSLRGQYMLYMHPDGDLEIYNLANNTVVTTWSSGTYNHPGAYAVMQGDGNFCIYAANGTFLWMSGTNGTSAQRLEMEDDGRIIIFRSAWASGTSQGWSTTSMAHPGCDVGSGTGWTGVLGTGQCYVSPNGRYEVLMQTDGNLVLSDRSVSPAATLWSTSTGVTAFSPGVVLQTLYTYDALGNLTCVEQHGNASGTGCGSAVSSDATSPWRVRRFTYDSLSRLLTAKNPEAGQTTYQYDNDSNLISKTDARGVTINYNPPSGQIDALHRVRQKTYSDGTPTVTYQYDTGCCGVTPANPVGRMTAAFTTNNTELIFSYDPLGHLKIQWDCPPSGIARGFCYTMSANYDEAGNIISLTYPDGHTVASTYNSAGRMISVNLGTFPYYTVPQTQLAGTWGYWPTGAMNRGTFGNGVIETTGYNNRLQVSSIVESTNGTPFFSKSYGYYDGAGHNNGNILSIADTLASSRNQTFTYDSLNRIATGAQADNSFNLTFSYDPWGNMTESGTSNFPPMGFDITNRVHQSTSCTPNLVSFCYDAAGDMLMDNHNHAFIYDGEARIKTVDGTAATYTYNALGNRVRKDAGTSTEYFFFGGNIIAELNPVTGAYTDYIFGYGKRIAKDTSGNGSGAQYYHSDQVGSARVMTDTAGNKIMDCTFNPFGEQVVCSPDNASNHYRFSGKEFDSESQLDDFGARYFSSSMGRWLTPDWSDRPTAVPYANFGDPQSLNLYLYVRNDPVSNVDADGHIDDNADPDHPLTAFPGPCNVIAADPSGRGPCGSGPLPRPDNDDLGKKKELDDLYRKDAINPEGESYLIAWAFGKIFSAIVGEFFGIGSRAAGELGAGASDGAMTAAEKELVRELDRAGAKALTNEEKRALEKNVRAILDKTIKNAKAKPSEATLQSVRNQMSRPRFQNLNQIDPKLRAELESALQDLGISK